jgi:hypothetical protein
VERTVRLGLANPLLKGRGRERCVEGSVGVLGNVVGLGYKALEAIVVTVKTVVISMERNKTASRHEAGDVLFEPQPWYLLNILFKSLLGFIIRVLFSFFVLLTTLRLRHCLVGGIMHVRSPSVDRTTVDVHVVSAV